MPVVVVVTMVMVVMSMMPVMMMMMPTVAMIMFTSTTKQIFQQAAAKTKRHRIVPSNYRIHTAYSEILHHSFSTINSLNYKKTRIRSFVRYLR